MLLFFFFRKQTTYKHITYKAHLLLRCLCSTRSSNYLILLLLSFYYWTFKVWWKCVKSGFVRTKSTKCDFSLLHRMFSNRCLAMSRRHDSFLASTQPWGGERGMGGLHEWLRQVACPACVAGIPWCPSSCMHSFMTSPWPIQQLCSGRNVLLRSHISSDILRPRMDTSFVDQECH